jgi:hypothetical protein
MNLAFSNYREYLLSADGYASSLRMLEGIFRKKYKAAFPEDNSDVLDDAKSDFLESDDDCLYEELVIRQELKMKDMENRSLIEDNLPQLHSLLNDNGETGKATAAGGRHVIDDQVPGPSSQMYTTNSSSAEAGAVDLEECRGMVLTPPPPSVASPPPLSAHPKQTCPSTPNTPEHESAPPGHDLSTSSQTLPDTPFCAPREVKREREPDGSDSEHDVVFIVPTESECGSTTKKSIQKEKEVKAELRKNTTPMPVPLTMEFGAKPMTYDEKARLLAQIYQLQDKVGFQKIIGIIKYHEPTVEVNDNFELDMESLQPSTLRDLEVTIAATLKRKLPKLSCE